MKSQTNATTSRPCDSDNGNQTSSSTRVFPIPLTFGFEPEDSDEFAFNKHAFDNKYIFLFYIQAMDTVTARYLMLTIIVYANSTSNQLFIVVKRLKFKLVSIIFTDVSRTRVFTTGRTDIIYSIIRFLPLALEQFHPF